MKKFLAMVVAVFMLLPLCIFAACSNADLEKAKSMLETMYQYESTTTAKDFVRAGVITVDGIDYKVTWKTNVDETKVKITPSADGSSVTIDIDEKATEAYAYSLTATITNAKGNIITLSYNYQVPKYVPSDSGNQGGNTDNPGGNQGGNTENPGTNPGGNQGGNQGGNDNPGGNQGGNTGENPGTTTKSVLEQIKDACVTSPKANEDYVMVMCPGPSSSIVYYVTGKVSTTDKGETFLETSTDRADAATVSVELASDGFYIAVKAKGDTSVKYLGLVDKSGTNPKTNVTLVSDNADAAVYSVNADKKALVAAFNGNNFFLGTYGTYDTIGSSSDFYFNDKSGNNAIDVSQWAARLILSDVTITAGGSSSGNQGTNPGGNTGTENPGTNPGGNQGGTTTTTPDGTTVTFDLSGKGVANTGTALTGDIVLGEISITCSKSTGQNDPKYYEKDLRTYYGNEITIKAADGKTIKSITFTFTANNNGTLSNDTVTVTSGTAVTVSANSIMLKVGGGSANKTNGQIRFTSIVVVYE